MNLGTSRPFPALRSGPALVEWSNDLTTWRSDWSSLTGIQATGTSVQKPIPRFFRVKKRTE